MQRNKSCFRAPPGLPINPLPCPSSFKTLYNESRKNTFWKRKVLHYLHPLLDEQYFVMHFHFPSTQSSPIFVIWKRQPVFQPNTQKKASIILYTCYFRLNLEQKLTEEKLAALKEGSTLIENNDWNSVEIMGMTTVATIPHIYSYFLAYMLKATKMQFYVMTAQTIQHCQTFLIRKFLRAFRFVLKVSHRKSR